MKPGDSRKDSNQQFQKKYVPKTSLTSSLRENSTHKFAIPEINSENKQAWQQRNSVSNEISLKQQKGRFVMYLPQDDAVAADLEVADEGLDAEETQAVFYLLIQELSALLKMTATDFCKTVATDFSLHQFLDTYLQYKRRWYDKNRDTQFGEFAGLVTGDQELCRLVFMILYRMSSNQDRSRVPAKESLNPVEHKNLLLEKGFFDIPKLMDICAIFGHDNPDLTKSLVSNALISQPGVEDQIKEVIPQFLHVFDTMHKRIQDALPTPKVDVREFHEDLLDVMDFINDAIVTMDAFVEAYAPAAAFFISSNESEVGKKHLFPALTNIHDSLLPVLHKGFIFTRENGLGLDCQPCLKVLAKRIVKFSWGLLYTCYLSETLCSFSHIASTNIFPAQVEEPRVRGDIIVQAINNMASSPLGPSTMNVAFLSNLNRRHDLMYMIDEICQNGWVKLNKGQYAYISKLVGQSEVKRLQTTEKNSLDQRATHDMSTLALKDEGEETAILQSKISQIKDVFPDYGDGYLSACLEVYDNNVEEVIQHILEGTLHPDLLGLDTTLELKAKSTHKQSAASLDKGKGKIHESAYNMQPQEKPKLDYCYSREKVIDAALSSSSSNQLMNHPSSLSHEGKCSGDGRYVRRSKDIDVNAVNTFLDQKDVKDNSLIRSAILATQYEDEYDDSLDELRMGVADSGIEEIERMDDDDERFNPSLGAAQKKECPPAPWVQAKIGHGSYGESKYMEHHRPQFYVKDGKNYSYRVTGGVGVLSVEEAETLNKAEEETIYGLGRGGNRKARETSSTSATDNCINDKRANVQGGSQNGRSGHGRGSNKGNAYIRKNNDDNHQRKNGAMKKQFGGVGRY